MPNGNQMSAEQFAAEVKKKYPAYAKIPDQELTAKILEKYPQYNEHVMAPGVSQARATTRKPIESDFMYDAPRSYTTMSPTGIATSPMIPAKTQAETLGAGIGGTALSGAAEGLPWLIRMLAGASGAGGGAGIGNVATGGSPKEALATAAETTAISAPFAAVAESPFLKWLTSSKGTGAKLLQMAESKAGNLPVELSPETNKIVGQIEEQSKLGSRMPKVIKDLINRMRGPVMQIGTPTKDIKGPLTYSEARILQGNASQLTAEESAALKGRTKGLLKQFAQSFGQDVQKTAEAGGVGKQHAAGMKEYAMASSRNRTLVKAAKATAAGATTVGGYELLKQLLKQGHP